MFLLLYFSFLSIWDISYNDCNKQFQKFNQPIPEFNISPKLVWIIMNRISFTFSFDWTVSYKFQECNLTAPRCGRLRTEGLIILINYLLSRSELVAGGFNGALSGPFPVKPNEWWMAQMYGLANEIVKIRVSWVTTWIQCTECQWK